MLIAKCDQLLLVIGNMFARAQQQTTASQDARKLSDHRVQIRRMMKNLPGMNRVEALILEGKLLSKLLHDADW